MSEENFVTQSVNFYPKIDPLISDKGNDLHSPVDICILMPCYNNFGGLVQSINSIKYDRHRFLVLVVDDGSSVAVTRRRLYQHIPFYVNLQIISLKSNHGISTALNKGLEFIYANYAVRFIARLDCGDICQPQRFYRQISFLEDNPHIDLLGTWCYFKDIRTGYTYQYITPTEHKLIERSMYFRNVFVHPTVMWRVSALHTYRYPYNYPHAEDYGLFYDIISKKRTAIIDEFLVTCEINKKGISFLNRPEQLKSRLRVIWHYGNNKLLLAAGIIKLVVLIVLPYRIISKFKKRVDNHKPGIIKNNKIEIL
ncbi:MAG: glycosyltransferase [Chitinophagaceae bacterium]